MKLSIKQKAFVGACWALVALFLTTSIVWAILGLYVAAGLTTFATFCWVYTARSWPKTFRIRNETARIQSETERILRGLS